MTGPLDGFRVLELSRYIAAPAAGKALGEMGADVIKIEDPNRGDPMRYWQSGDRSHSPQFAAYNRTKRAITLNLKNPAAKDVLLRLVDSTDVVLENFRPGVMDRLGVGWDTLRAHKPELIYCAISGFGATGPYVDRPAYDTVISAMSGLYSQILDLEHPQPVGPAMSDLLGGIFAVQGILAALIARTTTGIGQFVDASMLRAILGFLVEPGSNYLDMGEVTEPNTRQRRAQAYGLVSSDGHPFVIHMSVPEKFWIAATDAFDRADLQRDERFASRDARHDNYLELDVELKAAASTRTLAEWFEIFEQADIPHARVNGFGEVFEDPQVQEMGIAETVAMPGDERPLHQVGAPLILNGTPMRITPPAPQLGQHTNEVLAEAGYSPDEVDKLREDGVL